MENIEAYIDSGILELYVLGELTNDERREVELVAAKYSEVREELGEIERSLQMYSETYAVSPPDLMRNKVLGALEIADEVAVPQERPEAKIASLNTSNKNYLFYKYGFAACFTLLVLSIVALITLNNKLSESNSQIATLQSANQKFASTVNYYDKELKDKNQLVQILKDPASNVVQLKGTAKSPAASMVVVFNAKEKEVMIDLASLNVPTPDTEHQYQLWALVDGKPVDLGVFDFNKEGGMKRMKSIQNAQAFAVTLEPKGGSVSPTLEQLIVLGNI